MSEIDRRDAIERLRQADGAILVTIDKEPVPAIGSVEVDLDIQRYEIGDVPDEFSEG